jgi:uncharacterized protein
MRVLYAHPFLALVILALFWALPSALLLKLEFDNAPEAYFPHDAPAVIIDRELRERFPQEEVVIALFEGEEIFSSTFLRSLHEVVDTLSAHPLVERVVSPTTADHISATPDGFQVERLVELDQLGLYSPEYWQQRAINDRFAPGLLVARDGSALALIVRPHDLENSFQRLELQRLVEETLDASPVSAHNTAIAGHVALDVAQLRAMIGDTFTFMPLTIGLGLLLLWLMFHRWLVVVLAAVTMGAAASVGLAALVILGKPYTLVSSLIAPFLSAVTVAMLVHLFSAVRHAALRGLESTERVRWAVRSISKPTIFTAVTTMAGLLSLTLSPIRPIETFGLVAAMGVAAVCFLVLVIVPPIVGYADRGNWQASGRTVADRVARTFLRLAVRRAAWIVAITVLALVIGLPQIRHVIVETDLYGFFEDDHPINQATARVEGALSGVMPMEVVLTGPDADSLYEPERLEALRDVQAWLDARPEVGYSTSLAEMVAQMHWAFHEEDPDYFAIPDSRPLISQYLLIYDGLDLHDVVDRDFQRTRVAFNLSIHGARELNGFMGELRARLEEAPPADLEWELAGMGRLFADQEQLLIDGQLRSLLGVTAMLFGLMLLWWRSVSGAALCMLPNLAPVAAIFIAMGVFGIWLDVATAMIASVAVGIAVDDTIHTYHGYIARRRTGATAVAALARTYRHTGRAVIATTIVLAGQFLILTLSSFQPVAAFGLLTAGGLVAALLFDLLLLPSLLVLGSRLTHQGARHPA